LEEDVGDERKCCRFAVTKPTQRASLGTWMQGVVVLVRAVKQLPVDVLFHDVFYSSDTA
jgi:hypothetical protein